MQKLQPGRTAKRLLRIIAPLVILALVIFFLAKNWQNEWQVLTQHPLQFNIGFLILAFVGFIAQELSYGFIWRSVLKRLGYTLAFFPCLRIYLASEFVRYIPGNVWHVLTRILWVGKYGVPRSVAFASMVIELITKLVAGALVFAASLLFWSDLHAFDSLVGGDVGVAGIHFPVQGVIITIGIIGIVASFIILHPRVLNAVLGFGLRILKRDALSLPLRYRDILLITFAWGGSWIIAGCAFYALLLSLWPTAPLSLLPVCIGIYALAWDIGFLSFITPSGLGFREGVIAAAFYSFPALVSAGIPLIIALLSRIISTVTELICVGVAYLAGGRQIRALQQEESARASSDGAPASDDLVETLPSNLEVERGIGK